MTQRYGIHGWSKLGKSSASTHAVPAPPRPLWLMPSPMNAQRRETTSTLRTAQATATEQAVRREGRGKADASGMGPGSRRGNPPLVLAAAAGLTASVQARPGDGVVAGATARARTL